MAALFQPAGAGASVGLRATLRLLGSFPYRMTRKTWLAGRRSRVDPFHFVPCKDQKSLLISPFPIRERTALNVNVERTIRITDRVSTKVAEDSLHNSFDLLRGGIQTVVGHEILKIRAIVPHGGAWSYSQLGVRRLAIADGAIG
jgi:hypothetical protein